MTNRSKKQETASKKVLQIGSAARKGLTVRKLAATVVLALTHAVLAQALPATVAPTAAPENVPVTAAPAAVAPAATGPAVALPPGHPAMTAPALPLGSEAGMPAGHPSTPGFSMTPEAGTGAPGMGTTLPAGHPPMTATTLPAGAAGLTGSLNISVIGGTANGASVGDEGVTVDWYSEKAVLLNRVEYKTDAAGKLTVGGIPLIPPTDVVVSIHHAGLTQQAQAPALTLQDPVQTVQMKVFDPTDAEPAWTVTMQHMIVEWAPDGSGAVVTEMLSVNNPTDKAWRGAKVPSVDPAKPEKRLTLAMPLPPEADKLELGGAFDEDASWVEGSKLLTGSPLFPDKSNFQLHYFVAARNGSLELPITAPAAVGNLIVFVPADGTQVTATGLSGGDPVDTPQGKERMYMAQNLAAGAQARLVISGIKPQVAAAEEASAGGTMSTRNMVVGAAFLLVLAGAGLMLMKKPAQAKAE